MANEADAMFPCAASATEDNWYRYEPLSVDASIRVVELHSGSKSDGLSCTIHCSTIAAAVERRYEALSYVWGVNDSTTQISLHCDGQTLSIGSNLASALRHLRLAAGSRMLWVDAICINQQDEDERSIQVCQMDSIYAGAHNVLIWVGEDECREAEDCFDLIQSVSSLFLHLLTRNGDIDSMPNYSSDNAIIILSQDERWDNLVHLMLKPWFGRVWVLQEIGVAQSALLVWGEASISWVQLVVVMMVVEMKVDLAPRINVGSDIITNAYKNFWRFYDNNGYSWKDEVPPALKKEFDDVDPPYISLLASARTYEATDQRDRVFAFANHPLTANQVAGVDYSKSADDVYLQTARTMLESDQQPWMVLSNIDHTLHTPSLTGERPSWVPRWDEGLQVQQLADPSLWYCAGGRNPVLPDFRAAVEGSTLRLRGVQFDKIKGCSEIFTAQDLDCQAIGFNSLKRLWSCIQADTSNLKYANTKDGLKRAFSLTLIAGGSSDNEFCPNDEFDHHLAYGGCKFAWNGEDIDTNWYRSVATSTEKRHALIQWFHAYQVEYMQKIQRVLHNRRIFWTYGGYLGVGHNAIEVDDVCCVFTGAQVPFILRNAAEIIDPNTSNSSAYRIVGESYIQGIMKGEIFDALGNEDEDSKFREQEIILV